jgi:hypothetical protein
MLDIGCRAERGPAPVPGLPQIRHRLHRLGVHRVIGGGHVASLDTAAVLRSAAHRPEVLGEEADDGVQVTQGSIWAGHQDPSALLAP